MLIWGLVPHKFLGVFYCGFSPALCEFITYNNLISLRSRYYCTPLSRYEKFKDSFGCHFWGVTNARL